MESPKSWNLDFNCPQYISFCSPVSEIGSPGSYFEIDHETGLRVSTMLTKESTNRTPLSEVNGISACTPTPHRQIRNTSIHQKSCSTTRKRKYSDKKYSCPSRIYDLRLTPARLSRPKNSLYCLHYTRMGSTADSLVQKFANAVDSSTSPSNSDSPVSSVSNIDNSFVNSSNQDHSGQKNDNESLLGPSEFEVKYANPQKNKISVSRTGNLEVKSTDDITLKEAKEFRAQLAAARKLNEKYMKKAIAAVKPKTNTSVTSQCTVAKPFRFMTDARLKNMELRQNVKKMDFISALRHNSPMKKPLANQITIPKPFNFTEMKKRKREESGGKQKTMAEQIATFQRQTPDRYRSAAPGAVFKPAAKRYSPRLVRPCSPNLQAAKRHRPVTALSKEEVEEIELKKIKAYKFQAKPFNRNLFSDAKLPKVKPQSKLKQTPFQREKRLSRQKESKKVIKEDRYQFHAQEIPKNILKTRVGLKKKVVIPVTEPCSPAFALKVRSQKWKTANSTELEQPVFKALPLPRSEVPFAVKLDKKYISATPFSFDQKDKQRFAQKEEKIQEVIEKENRVFEFRARPVPSPRPNNLPAVPKKLPTKPEPFNLLIDKLAEKKTLRKQVELEQQMKMEQEAVRFKAQPCTVVNMLPFVPEKSTKPLTESNEFQLSTQRRAIERESLNMRRMTAEMEKEAAAILLQKEKDELEQEKLRKLRKETVHKANPIRNYGQVEIKPSSKPLTQPHSPKFATDNRTRSRSFIKCS